MNLDIYFTNYVHAFKYLEIQNNNFLKTLAKGTLQGWFYYKLISHNRSVPVLRVGI